ncbi:lipoxygenase family protein [Acaryochloris marina NIES-2412]|uniref:lipoxygenase family protein n=1 Tax=Acaryochloris marina TaxID=155978 RepID=UPI00405A3D5E
MVIQTVSGKIDRQFDRSPFRDTLIEVWDRDFGLDDLVGSGRTNDNGEFNISYDTDYAGDTPDLTLKIIRLDYQSQPHVIFEEDGPRNVEGDYDFGTISIADWGYDPDYAVPLIRSGGAGIFASPQNFVASQTRKILLKAVPWGLRRREAGEKPSVEAAQTVFPENLTIKKGDVSRKDKFFVDATLNGFAPALMTQDSNGQFHVRYNLDQYRWDESHQSPSVHLTMVKNAEGNLIPQKIEWKLRKIASFPPEFSDDGSAEPGEGAAWEKAKLYFRIAEFIDGQVKGHLGRGHLNVGQYAVALYRNIQKSPILKLLHPHLKGVSAINTFGKDIIFGDQGVLALSPLNSASLIDVMRDDLGQCNWKNWSPRNEVNSTGQHSYAKIQNLYWNILNEYVDKFFTLYEEKIKLDWKEIYYFSQDLVSHSVPFVPPHIVDGEQYVDNNEISVDAPAHQTAISPITEVLTHPKDQDIQNLKQACAYAIYHATIWHDWRNDNQANYGGEIDYARLAIDYSVEDAAFQLFIVNILVDVKHGYLTKNEENDIPIEFISILQRESQNFEDLGYDLRDLRSRINI